MLTHSLEYDNIIIHSNECVNINTKVGEYLKVDLKKLELAFARACITPTELSLNNGIPLPTIQGVRQGKNARPATIGRIAKALNVDVIEILENDY